jgi:hypothetical protein
VKATGVPKTLKNFHGLCEVSSAIGQDIEADMENLKKIGKVRLKVRVVDHLKIPKLMKLAPRKLHYYRIYFQHEEVVELGWNKSDDEFLQDFEDIMDSQPDIAQNRDPKRLKGAEADVSSPYEQLVTREKTIVASTQTRMAMEERQKNLKAHDVEDARNNLQRAEKSLLQQMDDTLDKNKTKMQEGSGDNVTGKYEDWKV